MGLLLEERICLLPTGSIIFFFIEVAPMGIEYNFKGHFKIKIRQYVSLLKSPNVDAANIKC